MVDLPADWTAPPFPPRQALEGQWTRLEPLDLQRHGDDLAAAFRDADAVWTWLPPLAPADDAGLRAIVAEVAARPDILPYAVVERRSGRAGGFLTIMEIRPADGVAEIGYVAFAPGLQRTREATEAVFLLLRQLFAAGYRRVEWKCDNDNAPSRRAAARFGFQYEGLFRQHMARKGRNRDTAWFAMLDHEWPARERLFAAWLAPENFDGAGRQRTSLRQGHPGAA